MLVREVRVCCVCLVCRCVSPPRVFLNPGILERSEDVRVDSCVCDLGTVGVARAEFVRTRDPVSQSISRRVSPAPPRALISQRDIDRMSG